MGMGKVYRETSKPSSSSSSPSPLPLTTSTAITQTVNGSHEFKITGYSLAKGIGVGKYIASDTFDVGRYSWAIYFYPDGKSVEDNAGYVSMFIALASEGTDVRALFGVDPFWIRVGRRGTRFIPILEGRWRVGITRSSIVEACGTFHFFSNS